MGQSLCCFRHSKTKQQNVSKNRREDKRKLLKVDESTKKTLEECLKNSPAVNPRVQPRKRVYPSLLSPDSFHTPRMSFSSSLKVDDEAQRCGKGKKKVTFRLPEEDEMILFYSPAFDCINQS